MRTKAPWKPGERVCSLEELYRAADIRLSRKVPVGKYFRDLEETLEKAKRRLMEQDLQYAYVFYLRYVTVVVKHLPNMPDYNKNEHAKSRERASKNAKKALTVLERLQPILQERYDEYIKYLTSLPRPKAAISTYSTKHGMSDRKMSNPFEAFVSNSASQGTQQNIQSNDKRVESQGTDTHIEQFSLADALHGLNIGGNSTAHVQPRPKDDVSVVYPSVQANHPSTAQSLPLRSPSVASTHTHPQPTPRPTPQQQQTPALPPRPETTSNSPHYSSSYSPAHTYAPPSFTNDARQPTLPPKPHEYYGEITKPDSNSFMPPCFINAAHSSLTEGGVRMRPIQVPAGIFEEFIDIASQNTERNLETCGILCGKQIPGQEALAMTTLIIPKQSATSDTCVTEHEEELFVEQMERDLITLGWIHTHPSQTCFMSSLDLHTQCSYQLMLPEAIAIVCSPRHDPRFGIFRLTDPAGIDTIQNCKEKSAFHPHDDSKVIYTNASDGSHVILADYDFDIIDIRCV
ncbi:hypothetical protein IWW50_002480 [Coemansia erecta]|nr:hypothetical protein IWW50_002480 [Coemansia erecta]